MENNTKGSYFWTSYSDLMTSLFFIMLVLFVLMIALLYQQVRITQRERDLIRNRLREIEQIIESTKNLDKKYFRYEAAYKKYVLNIAVSFPTGESRIDRLQDPESLGRLREAGHAIQYAQEYAPLKVRNAIVPITNIGSRLAIPLVLLGILFSGMGSIWIQVAYVGVACFALCVVFQLVTLPTEFDASRRAMAAIEARGMLTQQELNSSRQVLTAAAMTYVAALAVSITQLLRLLWMVQRNDRR